MSTMSRMGSAPIYDIDTRDVVAVEHPMIVKSLENGLKTFGKGPAFSRILESESAEACIPLYLRHGDPMCTPILSRNTCTDNILLQITVPKRTGRKRKRGSPAQFSGLSIEQENGYSGQIVESDRIRSQSRRDDPAELQRTLGDNIGRYNVEAVAAIDQTHRFRGLADFQQSISHAGFVPRVRDVISSGSVDAMRTLKLEPNESLGGHIEIPPPRSFSIHTLPANWGWRQNTRGKVEIDSTTGEVVAAGMEKLPRFQVDYISADSEKIPEGWFSDTPKDPALLKFITELKLVFEERPIWARRALINRVAGIPNSWLVKPALKYIGYQFKGGPYKDCVVRYGLDPRTDSKYAIYQSMVFQTVGHEAWDAYQKLEVSIKKPRMLNCTTHIFDGKTIVHDGKTWQLCDISDPDLAPLIHNSPLRVTYDKHDGHLWNGTWAKVRSIMKIKLLGMLYNIAITAHHLEAALDFPDKVENIKSGSTIVIPFPKFSKAEREIMERSLKKSTDPRLESPLSGTNRLKKRKYGDGIRNFPSGHIRNNRLLAAIRDVKDNVYPPGLGTFQNAAPPHNFEVRTSDRQSGGNSEGGTPREGSVSEIAIMKDHDMDDYEMGNDLEFGDEDVGRGSNEDLEDEGDESETTDVVDYRTEPC